MVTISNNGGASWSENSLYFDYYENSIVINGNNISTWLLKYWWIILLGAMIVLVAVSVCILTFRNRENKNSKHGRTIEPSLITPLLFG